MRILILVAFWMVCIMSNTARTSDGAEWTAVAPLPEPNGGFMAGRLGGRILVVGGTNWRNDQKRWLDTVWAYDPATNRWQAGEKLPHPLAYAAAGHDEERFYLAGGADGQQGRREVWAIDQNLRHTRLGLLPEPLLYAAGAVHDGQFYLTGGTSVPDDWGRVTSRHGAFDLRTGEWRAQPGLPGLKHGVGIPAVAVVGQSLLCVGGGWMDPAAKAVRNVANTWAFDLKTRAWQMGTPFATTVRGLSAVALDDHRVYLSGGYGTEAEGFLSAGYVWDARQQTYSASRPLPFAALTALVVVDGHLYALGGEDKAKHRTDQCWKIPVAGL